jgi:2-isopropylmalate synthase
MTRRITLYDSTLRDGSQARGIDFTVADKLAIAHALDAFGIDYIEGGFAGANPTDDAFFADAPVLKKAKLTAFGMTRRAGRSAANDPGLQALLSAGVSSVCLVGKAWDYQVKSALKIALPENLRMIDESIRAAAERGLEVTFDAEHFFDGFASNPEYAVQVCCTAYGAGARWVVLCDTNGGSLPDAITRAVTAVAVHVPGTHLGVHCHNDADLAVANSLAAVEAGVSQIQGTINGIGERCGNANLISILPTLMLKRGYTTGVSEANLMRITHLSRLVDDRLNRSSNPHAPYVGVSAFAHKGGLHVSAMSKDSTSYEHVRPEQVGNMRMILVSDKAGRANILSRLSDLGIVVADEDERVATLVRAIKERESLGYAYEDADASFALLARRLLADVPEFFRLDSFRVMDERRLSDKGKITMISEATVKLSVGGKKRMTVAEGNGPVNALDAALRKVLIAKYPKLKTMQLVDYKVRILTPKDATAALTRVMIESRDDTGKSWTTIGVSHNVIDASYEALSDAICYHLAAES